MDNLNEEIDLVLAGSLYEVLAEQDPQDGAFVWMDRPRSKKEPETPDEDEEEREEPERDDNKAQKRAAALKRMKKQLIHKVIVSCVKVVLALVQCWR